MRSKPSLPRVLAFTLMATLLVGAPSASAILIAVADDNEAQDFDLDGTFDQFFSTLRAYNQNGPGQDSFRFGLEFDLTPVLSFGTIASATISLYEVIDFAGTTIEVHGYAGDGTVSLLDLEIENFLTSYVTDGSSGVFTYDVTPFIQALITSGTQYAGFVSRKGGPFNSQSYRAFSSEEALTHGFLGPTLEVKAAAAVPEPGTLSLLGAAFGLLGIARRRSRRNDVRQLSLI